MNVKNLSNSAENKLESKPVLFCAFKQSLENLFVPKTTFNFFFVFLQRANHYFLMAAESGNANALAYLGKVSKVIRNMLCFA